MKLKSFITTALCLTVLFVPTSVRAATFSVRLGQPKTPTNQNNIKLTYVALDSDNRSITVKCFKKGPGDSGFSQFSDVKTMIPGGNTDHCLADSSVISTKGTYSFYVTGEVGSEIVASSIVSLDYNVDGPGTPSEYSKEKINNCDYRIKFKTADDGGKTVKVQLFRSDNLSISVNADSVIAAKDIASNTTGEIINSVPECNKNYYYEIRAVDAYDNVSGVIGDSFTTTQTTTSTTTSTSSEGQTASGNSGAKVVNGSSQVNNPEVTQPGSEASKTDETNNLTVTQEPSPAVLGTSTNKKNLIKWLVIPVLLIVGFLLVSRRRQPV